MHIEDKNDIFGKDPAFSEKDPEFTDEEVEIFYMQNIHKHEEIAKWAREINNVGNHVAFQIR